MNYDMIKCNHPYGSEEWNKDYKKMKTKNYLVNKVILPVAGALIITAGTVGLYSSGKNALKWADHKISSDIEKILENSEVKKVIGNIEEMTLRERRQDFQR